MGAYRLEGSWTIVEEGLHPGEETSRATVFALANGLLGLRGAPEEISPLEPGVKGFYRNGIFDTPRGKLTEREIVGLPDPTAIRLRIDGEAFDPAPAGVLSARRELDMRHATLRREVRWHTPEGVEIVLRTERFLPLTRPREVRMRIEVEAAARCSLELEAGVVGRVWNRWADHARTLRPETGPDGVAVTLQTFDPGHSLTVSSFHRPVPDVPRAFLSEEEAAWEAFRVELEPGFRFVLERVATVALPGEERNPSPGDAGPEHRAAWEELWRRTAIEIDGDEEALLGLRFAQFHLLAAAPWHDDRLSIPARGLQGQDYYGSVFWDCEVFVLPFLIATCPEAARNALLYRVHTLDGARRKAERFGYRGAFFAWQSQETGDEQCDLYVFTDPRTGRPLRSYFADEQIHISADVAWAFWQYWEATGDASLWIDGGIDVVVEVARFFVSRCTERGGALHLDSVLGPDEYHERVDDDAYTNALARESLLIAADALELLREQAPDVLQEIRTRLELTSTEIRGFVEAADRLFVPAPDPETGLIEQFAGYFDLRDEPLEVTRARLAHPELHPGGPHGPYQETRNIKQADVAMMLFLLRERYDARVKSANFDFYEPRTAHDSSLSPMAYALLAAEIGRLDYAYRYFLRSALMDLRSDGPHWNHGIHAAALGGAWQAVVHGFLGVRLRREGVVFDRRPVLPPGWQRVSVPLSWSGQAFVAEVEAQGSVRVRSRSKSPLPIVTPRGRYELAPGKDWIWPAEG